MPIPKLIARGMLFVWVDKEIMYDVLQLAEQWRFKYGYLQATNTATLALAHAMELPSLYKFATRPGAWRTSAGSGCSVTTASWRSRACSSTKPSSRYSCSARSGACRRANVQLSRTIQLTREYARKCDMSMCGLQDGEIELRHQRNPDCVYDFVKPRTPGTGRVCTPCVDRHD